MRHPISITKEFLKKRMKDKEFFTLFISGSNLHPNKTHYKYYWWIYSLETAHSSAHEVFYKDEFCLSTKEFIEKISDLENKKIPFAYVNLKLHRLGSTWNYERLKEKYPDIEFAPAYEDDTDEIAEDGHK